MTDVDVPLPTGTVTFLLTDVEGSTSAWQASTPWRHVSGAMAAGSDRDDAGPMSLDPIARHDDDVADTALGWVDGIDVFEHHCINFASVAAQGTDVAIVRAGRGTRQDVRWIEHTRSAYRSGLAVGSYWHVYPSRTDAHHQAELWAAAIGSAGVPFGYGHWADISTTDGFPRGDLGRYVAAFLRRADELVGAQVGVFSAPGFWQRHVGFSDPTRPWWSDRERNGSPTPCNAELSGVRVSTTDRGGAGRHRVRRRPQPERLAVTPQMVERSRTESVDDWRSRGDRTPEIAVLQVQLNDLGARLVVDGVFGPQTDAAVRICELLCRRDRLPWPFGTAPAHGTSVC